MRPNNVSSILHIFIFLAFGAASSYVHAQSIVLQDTTKNAAKNPSATGPDSSKTVDLEAMKANSDIKAKIDYQASDYMLLDLKQKTLKLVNTSSINYDEMNLKADTITMNWESNILTAKGKMDSTGQLSGRPQFEENGQAYRADSMSYNIQSQKGLVYGARTKQDENYILAGVVKKEDGDTYYIENGKFTTCDAEHPHYYIKSNKLKIIPRDKIITGPLMLVIEDFPLPLIVPFGFFPNQTSKKSGIIMPTYGEAADRGFFLRGLGYFWAVSDKFDLKFEGDIFSKGGWRVAGSTSYNKRYLLDGTFGVEYAFAKFGESTDPSFRTTKDFWVRWNHNQKLTPQARLTANVNAGTSTYNQNFSYNEEAYLSSNFKSTVSYNQSFPNTAWGLNTTLDYTQNTGTQQVTLSAPTVAINRSRWFPFKGKNSTGNKWYHKIGATYNMRLRNQITVPDSLFDDVIFRPQQNVQLVTITTEGDTTTEDKRALDYYRNGIQHTIPINTQLSLAKYINITPGINFNEYWYIKTLEKEWQDSVLVSNDVYGFAAARDFNVNVNTSTNIYGVFQFKKFKNKKQIAMRHTVQPSLGYTFKPDFSDSFWGFYNTVQSDTAGNTETYSRFAGQIFSGPTAGETQSLNFGLNNILELKFRSKEAEEDTTIKDPYTRINIFDNVRLAGSYNFAADSLNLSFINFNARTNILNNKFSVQVQGNVDPYAVNAEGRRINTFRVQKNGTIGRLNDLNIAFNASLQSKRKIGTSYTTDEPLEKPKRLTEEEWNHIRYYRDNYVDFNIPWRMALTYNLRYTNTGLVKDTTMTLNFNGDFNMTPKWKIGFTSGYDFQQRDFSYTSVSIYRDLHCWEMSMSWIPFGARQSYNFSINVKSSTLKDLKLTKRRDFQDRF